VEGYLMTTPGGINAVLGTAAGLPQVDVTLVTVAQMLRLLAAVLVVPALVRRLHRHRLLPAAAGATRRA
jgi:uncharacterized membrane protein AbrB (regulator of aidB expression)